MADTLSPVTANGDTSVVGAGPKPAVDLASAVLATQIAILAGMIKARVVDAKQMRDWLQSLIDALPSSDRETPYGLCLQHVVFALERNALPHPATH